MRTTIASIVIVAGCICLAASAESQSLAEIAKKEKARRAANAQSSKSDDVVTIDETALRNSESSTFSAVESSVQTAAPASLQSTPVTPVTPRAPRNPRGETRTSSGTPSDTAQSTSSGSKGMGNTDLSKGWSTDKDNTTQLETSSHRPLRPGDADPTPFNSGNRRKQY